MQVRGGGRRSCGVARPARMQGTVSRPRGSADAGEGRAASGGCWAGLGLLGATGGGDRCLELERRCALGGKRWGAVAVEAQDGGERQWRRRAVEEGRPPGRERGRAPDPSGKKVGDGGRWRGRAALGGWRRRRGRATLGGWRPAAGIGPGRWESGWGAWVGMVGFTGGFSVLVRSVFNRDKELFI